MTRLRVPPPDRLGRALTALLALCPAIAAAEFEGHPYVAWDYAYDSNVFSLANPTEAFELNGDSKRSDTFMREVVGADTVFGWGQDTLTSTIEGRRFLYDRLTSLDHNEYLYNSRLDWKALAVLTGDVSIRQERRAGDFADKVSTQLSLERDLEADGDLSIRLSPDWKIVGRVNSHKLDSPLPGAPQFSLRENGGEAGFRYTRNAPGSVGAIFRFLHGYYDGISDGSSYVQYTATSTFDYTISGLTQLSGEVGYTDFRSRVDHFKFGGLNATVNLRRQISGKTIISFGTYRRVESYIAGADTIILSGVTSDFDWHLSAKITLEASYEWLYTAFHPLEPGITGDSQRRDHDQTTHLKLTYAPRDWASASLLGTYYNRGSDSDVDTYNRAVVGVELRLYMP